MANVWYLVLTEFYWVSSSIGCRVLGFPTTADHLEFWWMETLVVSGFLFYCIDLWPDWVTGFYGVIERDLRPTTSTSTSTTTTTKHSTSAIRRLFFFSFSFFFWLSCGRFLVEFRSVDFFSFVVVVLFLFLFFFWLSPSWRSIDFLPFYRVLLGFYQVILGFTELYWVFTWFSWVLPSFTGFLIGFIGFYRVLLGCTGLYWVLLGFTRFYKL